jgi:hypothetical protein
MFNCTVIGTDFVSFTFFAVVIFLPDFLELFGPVSLDILFSLTFNNNKNLFYLCQINFLTRNFLTNSKHIIT